MEGKPKRWLYMCPKGKSLFLFQTHYLFLGAPYIQRPREQKRIILNAIQSKEGIRPKAAF
jgi:hypothetical protein